MRTAMAETSIVFHGRPTGQGNRCDGRVPRLSWPDCNPRTVGRATGLERGRCVRTCQFAGGQGCAGGNRGRQNPLRSISEAIAAAGDWAGGVVLKSELDGQPNWREQFLYRLEMAMADSRVLRIDRLHVRFALERAMRPHKGDRNE